MAEKKVSKGRKYKCPVCKQSEVSSLLVQHEVYPKRWMHPECRDEAIEKKRINTIEQEEKDSMYVKFSEIYGIDNYEDISSRIYTMFSNLRAGNPVFKGRSFDKRYREGFSYPVIEKAIEYCEKEIKYSIETKNFTSTASAMFYGMKIIVDKIPFVQKQYDKEQRIKEFNEANRELEKEKEIDIEKMNAFEKDALNKFKEANRKRKRNEKDISSFLSGEEII